MATWCTRGFQNITVGLAIPPRNQVNQSTSGLGKAASSAYSTAVIKSSHWDHTIPFWNAFSSGNRLSDCDSNARFELSGGCLALGEERGL